MGTGAMLRVVVGQCRCHDGMMVEMREQQQQGGRNLGMYERDAGCQEKISRRTQA